MLVQLSFGCASQWNICSYCHCHCLDLFLKILFDSWWNGTWISIVFSERGRFLERVWYEKQTYKMRNLTLNIHVPNILSFYYIKSNKIRHFLTFLSWNYFFWRRYIFCVLIFWSIGIEQLFPGLGPACRNRWNKNQNK